MKTTAIDSEHIVYARRRFSPFHAWAVNQIMALVTNDPDRFRTYFPKVRLVVPDSGRTMES